MRTEPTETLAKLQNSPRNIRNICILAHVDHGKTTLADTLVASNGIISQRMAGKLRYLDSREDEQVRGITMKSSAISLHYQHLGEDYLVNLIDSPGHVDFSSEVSTAVRLCDGALVLVDVVEGVCPQTHAVLRQAWMESIKPVLVLNKVDRLITELRMNPLEAHVHLQQILEQVNAITGELFTSEILQKSSTVSLAVDPQTADPQAADPQAADPQAVDPQSADPQTANPQAADPQAADPQAADPQAADPQAADPQAANPQAADPQAADPQTADPQAATDVDDQLYDWSAGLEDTDDSDLYFSPDQGNVVFGSAIDGWGFGIQHFAELYSSKLGFKSEILKKTLWGDFYLENKTKRIRKGAQAKGKKPLFVQLILENLWQVYEAVLERRDKEKVEKIIKSMKLKIQPRDSRHSDARVLLQAITSQWLPLSAAVLDMVCQCLPSPLDVSSERVEKLLCSSTHRFESLPKETRALKNDFLACSSSSEAPVIIYVSKMISVQRRNLPQYKQRPLTAEEISQRREVARQRHADRQAPTDRQALMEKDVLTDGQSMPLRSAQTLEDPSASSEPRGVTDTEGPENLAAEVFIAFARVFSGTVRPGMELYVLGPKHDPASLLQELAEDGAQLLDNPYIHRATVSDVYMFMGKELESMEQVPAGNLIGLGGVEEYIIKSATLSSTYVCPAFTDMYFEAAPIVKVALEPAQPSDMRRLAEGLQLLNQADPCVRVSLQETGEHVMMAAGEVHLHKCLHDLRTRYAKVEINVSPTLVPFRETIIPPPTVDNVNEAIEGQVTVGPVADQETGAELQRSAVELQTTNRMCTLRVHALPLPETVTSLLSDNAHLLQTLDQHSSVRVTGSTQTFQSLRQSTLAALRNLQLQIKQAFSTAGQFWQGAADQIWAFGPKRNGPNLLLNRVSGYNRPSIWSCLEQSGSLLGQVRDFDNSVVSGFQMAALSGPLCEEPMRGVAFVVEHWTIDKDFLASEKGRTRSQQLSGAEQPLSERRRRVSERRRTLSGMFSEDSDEDNDYLQAATVYEADQLSPVYEDSDKRHGSSHGPFSGQLIYCSKEVCRRAFQANPQRLMAAMYSCNIQATTDVLGKLYGVIGKRSGRVLDEDMREGTSIFNINALLPVVESFGFAEEIRKKTSGLASPQLRFSHWEVIDMDPFWVPTTEEEYLHFGEKADSENRARRYMDQVRKRKGLAVQQKLVESAEKQRNLSRNK